MTKPGEARSIQKTADLNGVHKALISTLQVGTGWFPEKPGGLARVFYDLSQHAYRANIEFRGLVTGSAQVSKATGSEVVAFSPTNVSLLSRWAQVRKEFRSALQRKPVDLIVSHFALYTFPVLDMIDKRPLVVHFHGPWALESAVEQASSLSVLSKRLLEATVYRRASHFIVLSQAFKNVLSENYKIPQERIHIVPGGIDTAAYDTGLSKQAAREKLGWPQDRPIVLSVRRLVRRQGLENLISAMSEAHKTYPDALLYIAGQGAIRSELETQITQLGLAEHVKLLGYVPDELLATTYRAADFSVVPTVAHEGFGLITIESLAAGTPVLVTPVGGLPEVVQNLSLSLVLEDSTVPSLVKGIQASLSGELSLPDSETCQRYVRENFDHSHIIVQTRRAYELALEKQKV